MSSNVKQAEFRPEIEVSSDAINLPDRDARISELAYLKAEKRGFVPGHELEDWLEAESEYLF